jgi:hypothetical protein
MMPKMLRVPDAAANTQTLQICKYCKYTDEKTEIEHITQISTESYSITLKIKQLI